MATIGQEVELKTSKSGKPFCSFGAVVTMGQDEGGKDISQCLRIGCFGDVAEQLAARAKKGDKIYATENSRPWRRHCLRGASRSRPVQLAPLLIALFSGTAQSIAA